MAPDLHLLGQHTSDDLSHPNYSVVRYSEGQSHVRTLRCPTAFLNQGSLSRPATFSLPADNPVV